MLASFWRKGLVKDLFRRPLSSLSVFLLRAPPLSEWRGNIRRLRNTIDRIAVLCDDDPVTEATVMRFIDYQVLTADDTMESVIDQLLELDIDNLLVSGKTSHPADGFADHRHRVRGWVHGQQLFFAPVPEGHRAGATEYRQQHR